MHRSPLGARGFLLTIGLLGGGLLLAFLFGLLIYWGLQAAFPRPADSPWPGYLSLFFTALAYIPMLIVMGRRFPYITDWYYLLPAILFLLAFTVYPIILTVYYGFTNYNGVTANRAPDRASEIQVVSAQGRTLTLLEDPTVRFRCEERGGCAGIRLELTSEAGGRSSATITRVEGTTLELNTAPSFTPTLAYRINDIEFVGFGNFARIFASAGTILWPIFVWNIIFAFFAVATNAVVGLILGLMLNNKNLALRGFYRTALIISWAMPMVISFQIWSAMLNVQFGPINRFLGLLGSYPIPWLTDPEWAKVAVLLVNVWLGFPYWMTATLSALSTIPDDVYEAAKIDGANPSQTLFGITLPLLRQPFIPLLLGSFAFNFNNFGLIFLLTGGGPAAEGRPSTAQSTDILISWAYKTAFQSDGGQAWGLGGAISVIIFIITVGISLINFRVTGALKEVR